MPAVRSIGAARKGTRSQAAPFRTILDFSLHQRNVFGQPGLLVVCIRMNVERVEEEAKDVGGTAEERRRGENSE
jgi:hypothetical protein